MRRKPVVRVDASERRRRFAVKVIFALFAISLAEGALRKWLLPSLATPLYFLRDPVLAVLYAYAAHHGFFGRGQLARLWLGFAAVTAIVGLVPYGLQGEGIAWILGVRTYWLYMPLAFITAVVFRRSDVEKLIRWNLVASIPYAALVVLQYRSPNGSFVNKTLSAEGLSVPLPFGIVRPNGLFTFTAPNVQYTAFVVACLVAYVFLRRSARGNVLLMASVVPVGSMAVLTGSRTIYFLVASVLLTAMVGSFAARPDAKTMSRQLLIIAAVAVSAVLLTTRFEDMLAAMSVRVEQAERSEGSVFDRASDGLAGFVEPLTSAPILGNGIGSGTPAITGLLESAPLAQGEFDLERNVNELGPIIGLVFVVLRFLLALTALRFAFSTARRGYSALLPLAGFVAVEVGVGQLTNSPVNAFLPWLTVGIVLSRAQVVRAPAMLKKRSWKTVTKSPITAALEHRKTR